jgi:putative redox protein
MSFFEFKHVVGNNGAGITANPAARIAHYKVESRQESGLRSRVNIRQFTFDVDEPASLAGTDTAPSPVEYALAALATCQEITYRLHADHLGIPLDSVAVTLEGDIDLRGFFAVDDDVRAGFERIWGTVKLESSVPFSELQRLKAHVDAHCPVFDLLTNTTPVTLSLVEPALVGAGTAGASVS